MVVILHCKDVNKQQHVQLTLIKNNVKLMLMGIHVDGMEHNVLTNLALLLLPPPIMMMIQSVELTSQINALSQNLDKDV